MAVIINKDGGGSGGSAILGFILGAVMLVAGIVGTLPNCGVSEWLGYRMAKGPHRCGPPPAQICSG